MEEKASGAVSIRAGLLRVAFVAAILFALAAAFRAQWFDPATVRDYILSFGTLAPLIWVLLYLVAVFIPYATTVMTIAAGLAFGTLWGTVLTFCVTIFASLLPFTVSRRLGRTWVEDKLGNTRVKKYADLINRNAFLVFFYLRLVPSLPYELQNHIAGVSRITYREFMLASFLGVGPILFILAFLGDSLSDPAAKEFWIAAGVYVFALLAPVIYAGIARKTGRKRFLEAVAD